MSTCIRPPIRTAGLLLALLFLLSLTARAGEKVVIGISPSLTAALNIIAKQQGFFAQQGIDAELRVIESGSRAVTMMMNEEIDISESTLFPLVDRSFARMDFRIYTQVSISGNDNMIVARRDKGINAITDLKGKKVGVLKNGFPLYVLDLMLLNAGIDSKGIQLTFEENGRLYQMLSAGELDAVCFYGAWIDRAITQLKDNAVLFHDERLVRVTVVHAAKAKTFERSPELFSRILKAYILAEEYVRNNPAATMNAAADFLKLDKKQAQKVWKPNLIHVSLEQSLIKDMENLAQWQIDTGSQSCARIPNYLDFIHFRSLKELDPKRVNIVN